MLLQTVRSSLVIFFVILCTRKSLADILDGRKCLVYEEISTEAPKVEVENVKVIYFNDKLKPRDTQVKYGQHIRLICDIHLPILVNISWHARPKLLASSLSSDLKSLDIKPVDLEYRGEYVTCVASMVSNPKKILKTIGAHIQIIDLTPPLISNFTPNKVTVMESDNITLSCIIVAGIPQPKVSWQVMRSNDDKFRDLLAFGEELIIKNASFEDDGQYRCIAENVKGEANKTIDMVVQKVPIAIIEEGSQKTFPYGNTTEITCRTEGYPLPKIMWKDSQGNELHSENFIINWHKQTSRLELQNMKRSENYSCFAENTLGKAVANVNVTVLSPFIVHEHPNAKTILHYGVSRNIICNITSSFPMTIKWFRPKTANSSELSEIHNEKEYNITSDETVLQIVSMDLHEVGNYTCEASLISDENEKIAFTTDIQIDDLAPPLLSEATKIIVMETNWITLNCKIVGGVPPPHLSWQVMRHGETAYSYLPTSSEILDVTNITMADAGKYRCYAENAMGYREQVTEVLVRKAPVAVIDEGSAVTVLYGSNTTFTCRVVAYPLPSIDWTNNTGSVITEIPEDFTVHEHEKTSKITKIKMTTSDTYFCNAKNSLGEDTSSMQITVLPAFVVHQYPEKATNVHYRASTNLVCNITSLLPMRIKWFHNSSEIHTSDRYTISANETVLYIDSVDLEEIGNYTCEASLVYDENPKEVFSSNVQIDDLRPPVITSYSGSSVTVKNLEELSLVCKASGNPEPVITWQAMVTGSYSYQNIGNGDSLCSTNFGSAQAGTYKCTAANVVGEDSRTINVAITY